MSKLIKAIFIDAKNKTITLVEIATGIQPLYNLIDCRCVDYVHNNEEYNADGFYIDDEGLMDGTNDAFITVPGYGQGLFAGSAVVVGDNGEGDSADVTTTVEYWQNKVKFLTRWEASREARRLGV